MKLKYRKYSSREMETAATLINEDKSVLVIFYRPLPRFANVHPYIVTVKRFNCVKELYNPVGELKRCGRCSVVDGNWKTFNVTKEDGNNFYKSLVNRGFKRI